MGDLEIIPKSFLILPSFLALDSSALMKNKNKKGLKILLDSKLHGTHEEPQLFRI